MSFSLANVNGRASLVEGGYFFDLSRLSDEAVSSDPMLAITQVDALHELADTLSDSDADGSLEEATLQAPVPRPRNSFGIGLNYRDHAKESKMELPKVPVVFSKYPSCISGPFTDIQLRAEQGDYEAELVVVIGHTTRDISIEESWSHVAGLMVGQDISDRELQLGAQPPQFGLGKSRDTYGPTGPILVSPDSFGDPDNLAITCDVNGERRQDDRTSSLIFDVSFLVSYLSAVLTLEPGDLIFTGTPAGVGMPDQRFLKPGDVVTTSIEGIGTIENLCR
ncbi:MAG: fumarylacetoacetate hydrolase [Acidimicrobiaceae bacterium]|nr:fumarylacetoacetate hydrolase [Acidimicrobiaceae bacterium]|tara:strand:- start:69200 stop:70036 length:837 start_codon:yes stop_codon:yes gene_type:complete